jgi:hypothetical protein
VPYIFIKLGNGIERKNSINRLVGSSFMSGNDEAASGLAPHPPLFSTPKEICKNSI